MCTKVAIDAAIFFFCFKSRRNDIKPTDMRRILTHLSEAPHVSLFVPISVLGETVIECLRGEQGDKTHSLDELHEMIDFWGSLKLSFLYPNALVATSCYNLVQMRKIGNHIDYRLTDADLVHLGYSLAYEIDYFLTTDKNLQHNVPEKAKLRVIDHEKAKTLLKAI